jgi:hypothetical protein
MGTEQFLTHEDKLESLTALRALTDAYVSSLCEEVGLSYSDESIEALRGSLEIPLYGYTKKMMIINSFDNLKKIDLKIEEIK